MQRILFIEKSTTLRHILYRTLRNNGFAVDSVSGCAEAIEKLSSLPEQAPYHCLILGWPSHLLPDTNELLCLLNHEDLAQIPVLVMSDKLESGKFSWVSGRKHTAFLPWDSHLDTVATINKLLAPEATEIMTEYKPDDIHILLVDDSPTARAKFRKLLQSGGYHVHAANGAEDAMQQMANQYFDIAIVDYFMPQMNGDVVCKKLRQTSQSSNFICAILTSTYHGQVISDSLAAGAVECMFKNEADQLFMARVAAMCRTVQITRHIEQDKSRLAGILSSVGDGVYGVDEQGLITFINPAALQLLAYTSAASLIGRSPDEIFHNICPAVNKDESDLYEQPLDARFMHHAITRGQELRAVESTFTRSDNSVIQVELTIFPLRIEGQQDGAVVAFRDVSHRKVLENELKWQANHDQLTQLYNRKYLEDKLEQEVNRLKRSNEVSALLYLDLDRFKYINDTIGHAAGDQLLIEISRQLQTRLRKADMLARLGGDEFAILMHNISGASLFSVADQFRQLLEKYNFTFEQRTYKINGSIGVTRIDQHTGSADEVLANADIACHISKGKGRNQTHVYDQSHDEKASMDMALGWSTRLHEALEQDGFELHYQPIVALQDIYVDNLPDEQGRLWEYILEHMHRHEVYYEVLLRLKNQNNQLISPNAFLPTAERFNMMQDIDNWVVRNALTQLVQMQSNGLPARLSVNLSGQSLDNRELLDKIHHVVDTWSLDPGSIIFEVTESSAINKIDVASHFIEALHKLGCHFALDDFGSGYSSFSHLKNLPVDIIKIDGQFIKDIATDPMDLAIVSSMVNIAHSLNKLTVAEFVEDAATLRLLKQCGVDYAQGYYISTPLSGLPPQEIGNNGSDDEDQTLVIKIP